MAKSNKTTKSAEAPHFSGKVSPQFYEKDIMYGMTTVGPRGQIVIPAEARKDVNLKPGDRLLVMGKFGKVLSLVKGEDVENIVSMIMDHVAKETGDKKFTAHLQKQLEQLSKYTKKK